MAHERGEQKREWNIKTQRSHLDVLQVTIVQDACISGTWYNQRQCRDTKIFGSFAEARLEPACALQ